MPEKRNLLNIPPGLMSKDEIAKMTFNEHDQKFMSRVLGFHYESMEGELSGMISSLLDTKYNEQTKTLAQVVMEAHRDHIREIKILSDLIKSVDLKVERISKKVGCHTRDINKIKKVIKEMNNIKL